MALRRRLRKIVFVSVLHILLAQPGRASANVDAAALSSALTPAAPAPAATSAPSCVFSTPAGTFDLAPLGFVHAFGSQDDGAATLSANWSVLFDACADVDAVAAAGLCGSAAPAVTFVRAPALLAAGGACHALGRLAHRRTAPLAANSSGSSGRVGLTVALGGGDSRSSDALERSISIDVVCTDVAQTRASRVAVVAGRSACAYTASVESRAGCPLECARDVTTGAVCGGESRGACSMSTAFVGGAAACACARGHSGPVCVADAASSTALLASRVLQLVSTLVPLDSHGPAAIAAGLLLLLAMSALMCCRWLRHSGVTKPSFALAFSPAGDSCCVNRSSGLQPSILRVLSSAHFRVCAALALMSILSVTLPSAGPRRSGALARRPSTRLSAAETEMARAEALFLAGTQVPDWVSTLRREGGAATLAAEADAEAARPENARWTAITATSNEYTTLSLSQDREDVWAFERFFWQKRGGIVLESGAEDGLHVSNSLFLQNYLLWHSILIEPGPTNFELLKRNREDGCLLLNAAICDK